MKLHLMPSAGLLLWPAAPLHPLRQRPGLEGRQGQPGQPVHHGGDPGGHGHDLQAAGEAPAEVHERTHGAEHEK